MFLLTTAISELVSPTKTANKTERERVGMVVFSLLIIVLEFITDMLDSIPRYFLAFGFSFLNLCLLCAAIGYTNSDIHRWPNSIIVFLYIVTTLSAIQTIYMFILKQWHGFRKMQSMRRAARSARISKRSTKATTAPGRSTKAVRNPVPLAGESNGLTLDKLLGVGDAMAAIELEAGNTWETPAGHSVNDGRVVDYHDSSNQQQQQHGRDIGRQSDYSLDSTGTAMTFEGGSNWNAGGGVGYDLAGSEAAQSSFGPTEPTPSAPPSDAALANMYLAGANEAMGFPPSPTPQPAVLPITTSSQNTNITLEQRISSTRGLPPSYQEAPSFNGSI